MPIDRQRALQLPLPSASVTIARERLLAFAGAIGETNPIYLDTTAARQAGHRDLPVPPTFFFTLEMEGPSPFGYLTELGVDLRRVLHAEQTFAYHDMAYAGDTLTLGARIIDVSTKKDGALEFISKKTRIARGAVLIAESTATMVVRNASVEPA
jgi:acyl dehydratase